MSEAIPKHDLTNANKDHYLPEGPIKTSDGKTIELGQVIGSGCNGTVYEVEGEDDQVAKFVKPDGLFVDNSHKWAEGEYRAIVERKQEPEGVIYVTPISLLTNDDNKPIGYTMKKITGVPLIEFDRDQGYTGPPLPKSAYKGFKDNLLALTERDLPHGDLKPDNIYNGHQP